MKAEFLKIAGVKTEKAFYKKYPTEAAFFKAHPEAKKKIKKAQVGINYTDANGNGVPDFMEGISAAQNIGNIVQGQMSSPGVSAGAYPSSPSGQSYNFGRLFGVQSSGGFNPGNTSVPSSIGFTPSPISLTSGSGFPEMNAASTWAKNNPLPAGVQDTSVPSDLGVTPPPTGTDLNALGNKILPYVGAATQVIGGLQGLRAERRAIKEARKWAKVTGVQAQAAESEDVDKPRQLSENMRRRREAFMPVTTGEEFFPIYGVGTNPLAKYGSKITKAQEGKFIKPEIDETIEMMPIDNAPEYSPLDNIEYANQIIEEEPYIVSDEDSAKFMEMYNRDQMVSTPKFDSNSARDVWVHKTGLPWAEAKKLGYTTGSAKDNIKLLKELKDPRFSRENLRSTPPKKSSQTRTPIQHRETPTGKLTPIKKPLPSYDDYLKSLPKYKGNQATLKQDSRSSYQRELDAKRAQKEYEANLYGERPLIYLSEPRKLVGDIRSKLNPMFTPESETSEADRREIMAIRSNPNLTKKQKIEKVTKLALKKVPSATANLATIMSLSPYTTYQPFPVGIGTRAVRPAGYIGQGARRIGQGAPKRIAQGYTPNFVMYQDGGMIGGNPTEIQNTYAPEHTLYDNLGYEPLDDSNQVKQYVYGGDVPKAQYGMEALMGGGTPWGAIGGIGTQLGSALTGNNAGGQVGSGIGTAAGMAIGGPVGGAIGGALGSVVGGLFGQKNQRRLRRAQNEIKGNVNRITASQFRDSMQGQFGGYMEDGGQLTNPQLITKFGEYSLKDLLAPDPTMNTLRAGGHIRGSYVPPSASGLSTMEEGGELQTYWGGYAEPMSYNPYLPDGGETVMFRGNSHDEYDGQGNTGIGVSFGNTDEPNVEVERGEPAVKLKDGGTGDENLVVYGNLKIPNYGVDLLGDKNAKGKKFKNYVADLSKTEQKQNKLIEKSVNQLDALDVRNSFDRLKLASLQASIKGGNMKLKEIAEKKIKAADLQNAINDTAEEYGIVADDLARGKVKFDKQATQEYAKYGKTLKKAQEGEVIRESDPKKVKKVKALKTVPPGQKRNEYDLFGNVTPEMYEQMKKRNPWYDWEDFDPTNKADVIHFQREFNKLAKSVGSRVELREDGDFGEQTVSADSLAFMQEPITTPTKTLTTTELKKEEEKKDDDDVKKEKRYQIAQYKQNPWVTALGQILPFLRPTDQEPLDPRQLMGEMYALSTNKLEPVQAQPYSPQLRVPYDISLQDQLNEITADQRATQRMLGYNPAAQANLAAQAYGAKSKVLADQFRANQAMKDQVYAGNLATLNDAQLKNLDIYDRQYTRQAQARSATKATAQAALNSISDKYAKNALENRTLGVYENLYNYRYDPAGRAINMNAPFQPFIPQMYSSQNPNMRLVKNADGTFSYVDTATEETVPAETTTQEEQYTPINKVVYAPGSYSEFDINNDGVPDMLQSLKKGGNVKKKKNYSQSSIVKMFK